MSGRGSGVAVAVHELLPSVARDLFTVLTQLGDAWFVFTAAALLYWFGDRERGAFTVAALLGALALTLALKGLFALPRPPESIQVGHADSYGFPSGHAIAATTLWGLLAAVVERGTRRVRAVAAAAVVAIVATSRLVIGVHYLVDVVVGVGVALAYLGALVRASDWRPNRAFAAAVALSFAALAINGFTLDAVATVAGVVGATATWLALDGTPRAGVTPFAGVAGLAALGGLAYAGNRLGLSLAAAFALNLLVPAGILALPLAVERAREVRAGARA